MNEPGISARVLQLTDPHLFADRAATLRNCVTAVSLERVLKDISRRAWPADLVAVTGDLVQDDSRGAYERFRRLLEPLGLPVHCVPGNHDVSPLMREVLASPPFHYCAAATVGRWLLIGIDSCIDGAAGGRVSEAEMRRLEESIRRRNASHVLVCLHHPPLPVGTPWLDEFGLENGADFLGRLRDHEGVRGVIFGHVHQEFDAAQDGIRVIGTPSTCSQFTKGSETFDVDDRPPAYRRLALRDDGGIDTELVWLDHCVRPDTVQ